MTDKEKLIINLIKYREKFADHGDDIIIKTYSPIITKVSFKNDSIDISSKLKGWNLLTGVVTVQFENVLNYVTFMMILGVVVMTTPIFLLDDKINSPIVPVSIIIILIVIIWTALFYLHYNIRYENIKNRVIEWTK
tara:strand:- start:1346 stop:1753 length:408 start_codon:yes stop_codon:yes gene_type:complete